MYVDRIVNFYMSPTELHLMRVNIIRIDTEQVPSAKTSRAVIRPIFFLS